MVSALVSLVVFAIALSNPFPGGCGRINFHPPPPPSSPPPPPPRLSSYISEPPPPPPPPTWPLFLSLLPSGAIFLLSLPLSLLYSRLLYAWVGKEEEGEEILEKREESKERGRGGESGENKGGKDSHPPSCASSGFFTRLPLLYGSALPVQRC